MLKRLLKRPSTGAFGLVANEVSSTKNAMNWNQQELGGPLRKKLKRKSVSWAPTLTQVRLFRTEDEPRKAGVDQALAVQRFGELGVTNRPQLQGRLQSASQRGKPPGSQRGKTSRHGAYATLNPAVIAAAVTQVTWRLPDRFELLEEWCVVAGDDSKEVSEQKLRESSALEAVYPRSSSIPDSPAEPSNEDVGTVNDDDVMIIPWVAADDEEEEMVALQETEAAMEDVHLQSSSAESGNLKDTEPAKAASNEDSCGLSAATVPHHSSASNDNTLRVFQPASNHMLMCAPPLPLSSSLSAPPAASLDPVVQNGFVQSTGQSGALDLRCGEGEVVPDFLAASAIACAALANSASGQGLDMILTQLLSQLKGGVKDENSGGRLLGQLSAKLPLAIEMSAGMTVSANPPPMSNNRSVFQQEAGMLDFVNLSPMNSNRSLSQQEAAARLVRAFGVASVSPQACATAFQPETVPDAPLPPRTQLGPQFAPLGPESVFGAPQRFLPGSSGQPLRPPFVIPPPLPPGPRPNSATFHPPLVGDGRGSLRPQDVHVSSDYPRPPPLNVLQNRPHASNEQWVAEPRVPSHEGQARMDSLSVQRPFSRPVGYMQATLQPPHGWRHEHERFTVANSNQNEGKAKFENPRRQKMCSFFNTAQGCRNGVNCTFLHSSTSSTLLTASDNSHI